MRGRRKIPNLYNIAERIWKLEQKTASKSDVAHCCALRAFVNFADRKSDGLAAADFLRAREQIWSNLRRGLICGIATYSEERYIVQHIAGKLMTQGKR